MKTFFAFMTGLLGGIGIGLIGASLSCLISPGLRKYFEDEAIVKE